MTTHAIRASTLLFALALAGASGVQARNEGAGASRPDRQPPRPPEGRFGLRPLILESRGRWLGDGVAYGPHRDGQFPGGPSPSREEIREDLRLMARHWRLLRLYGAVGPAETILDVIRGDGLDLKVMLGIWIAPEGRPAGDEAGGAPPAPDPEAAAANRRELEAGIRLAAAYPEIVVALCVGNETQVSWSDHRVPPALLLACIREARARAEVPVTTADDFGYWNLPESRAVAAEIDFITLHAHPLWNGILLDEALAWTRGIVAGVGATHPGRPLVLGETGWATAKRDEGQQAHLIKGRPGEGEQSIFYRDVTAWVRQQRVPLFWFEAFDENWKGADHPDEVEKHWGLYRSDRTPKKALIDGS